jgi:hypothetical protein
MNKFQEASWLNCRIEAFGIGQSNPDLIFIDLDDRDFCSPRAIKLALTMTLKRIKKKLNGYPTVYRSGRGYHIIQPIYCPVNLDTIDKFAPLVDDGDVNKAFLQFGARYLSDNKKDSDNRSSLKSCLLRILGSLNSKCKEAGIDAEVKIIQIWDGYRPDYRLLIGSFYADLVGKRQKRQQRPKGEDAQYYAPGHDYGSVAWIEKLLQTPIDDYRHNGRNLILVPYLVVRRGITDVDNVTKIVMNWADKCAKLRKLDPSRREYEKEARARIYEVMQSNHRIPPMRLETLKEKNPGLYETLKLGTLR